ncbi:MAG: ATP-binding protein [Desulfobacteraceae bacterium]|nr:ATP-binding protein [Desulfobacteraceae bacterium]
MELDLNSPDHVVSISERRRTEIEYHRKLNVRIALAGIPIFLFFSVFFYLRHSFFQATLHLLMMLNAASVVATVPRVHDLIHLMRLKKIGSSVAFWLLGISMVTALFGQDLHILFPYFFIYPMAVLLFFGERAGRYYAVIFCLITISLVLFFDSYPWSPNHIKLFKLNAAFALIIMVIIGLISERARVQMRDQLIKARNQAEAAEDRQLQTNFELKKEIERRIQSEAALSQSEKHYRALFEESAVSLWEEDWSKLKIYLDGLPQEAANDLQSYGRNTAGEIDRWLRLMRVTAANRAALALYEADTQAALFKNIRSTVTPEFDIQKFIGNRVVALYHTGKHQTDMQAQTFSGRKLQVMVSTTIPTGYEFSWEKVYTSIFDITEKLAMEEEKKRIDLQLQNSRHFQALATLAGGIAHQFNNALGGIYGNLDLLELKLRLDQKSKRFIDALRLASGRIARLTEQLLAYARGGKFQPKALSINVLIQEMVEIEINPQFPQVRTLLNLSPELKETVGDLTQIRASLAAVLTNAMEAMSQGGEVAVSTENRHMTKDLLGPDTDLAPGDFVVTTIEDHGMGMDEQTRQHIFEPFFSTKFFGRGLGMSATFGIIKNHDGDIRVASEPGKGTTVTIYLPAAPPTSAA